MECWMQVLGDARQEYNVATIRNTICLDFLLNVLHFLHKPLKRNLLVFQISSSQKDKN